MPKIIEHLQRFDCRFPNWPCALVAGLAGTVIARTLLQIIGQVAG